MPADGEDVAALATRLRREIGQANVLTDRQELHRCECDGLAVHKVAPALATLPENRVQVQAVELGDPQGRRGGATGADVLVTANSGCLMQIASAMRRSGRSVALAHTAEVLDASLRGTPYPWSPEARAPTHQGG
jgi:hypothetical protein